jgi:hypothetical protein
MRSSGRCHADEVAAPSVPIGFNLLASQTVAGVTEFAANETTRKTDTSQKSLQKPRKSLQTSPLASIGRYFLQHIQQALVEDYYKSLSTHQIPTELRAYFNALLRKFQSDEQFQKAIEAFAMEVTGKPQSSPIIVQE